MRHAITEMNPLATRLGTRVKQSDSASWLEGWLVRPADLHDWRGTGLSGRNVVDNLGDKSGRSVGGVGCPGVDER